MDAENSSSSALLLQNITKHFGTLTALEGVNASFIPGRIHGVLGENGAGKSTLMRVAAGLLAPDEGQIRIGDISHVRWNATQATAAGIAMVHQHFMLVPTLTVAENCALGRRSLGQWSARWRATQLVNKVAERTGLGIDPLARVESLSVGQRQRVEIIRALSIAGRVLILDEPTAVLTPREVDQLFDALVRLKEQGISVAFISHKLAEVARICDDLTILRRGRCVYSGPASGLSTDEMARHMVGATPTPLPLRLKTSTSRKTVLECRNVSAVDPDGHRVIREVDLEVVGGEIVGVAGVEGNGQDVLAAAIIGVLPLEQGSLRLDGQDAGRTSVADRRALGLAHIPEDRRGQGLVSGMNLTENVALRAYGSPSVRRGALIRWREAARLTREMMKRFDVRAGSENSPVDQLSGGNQQKLLLAREMSNSPRLIVAHNPVRGLDVAATRFVFGELLEQSDRGAGVLLIHSDLDELLAIADRVLVMYEGRLLETKWPACDRKTIGQLMLGGRP